MPALGSVITAMVTPFRRDGHVDLEVAARLMQSLVEHGSDALVICGTTGEAPTLDDAEKLALFELAVTEVGGRVPVIAGTGSNDTRHSVELTQRAHEVGVDAVLVVTPYYNKPPVAGIEAHFRAVAAATDRPLIVYNIPGRCVLNLEPELLGYLAEIENITAVKQAVADLDQARRIVSETSLALYAGDDALFLPFLQLGGTGVISVSSHLAGDRMQKLRVRFEAGDLAGARAVDQALADVYETLFITANPIPTKAALELLGYDVGPPRLPLVPATAAERAAVQAMLERQGLLEPQPA
jgi:4-hydroxy-tetrahydrodipicolinate synthase